MTWFLVALLAGTAMAIAHFLLGLPRASLMLFASALLFGLAGYALQGSPGQPAAAAAATRQVDTDGEMLVTARRDLFDNGQQPARFIIVSDAFARRGQYADAAQLLRRAVEDHPDSAEAWVALANALVAHADGQLTPAALHAFGKAEEARPDHPGAGFFLGVALIRSGRLEEARTLWAQMLAAAPADLPWRPALEERLERLDGLMAAMQAEGAQ